MTRRTFVPGWQLSRTPVEYIVEDVIPETGIGILYAPSTEGKSLVALKLAVDMINGTPFFGHETVKADVAMCLAEGKADAGIRLQAYVLGNGREVQLDRCRGGCPIRKCSCTKMEFPS